MTTNNPLSTRNHSYHSSSTSSYETKYRSSDSNTNNTYEREQRSRDPSPIGGYITSSSTATTRTQRTVDGARGSTAGYVPQHDYMNVSLIVSYLYIEEWTNVLLFSLNRHRHQQIRVNDVRHLQSMTLGQCRVLKSLYQKRTSHQTDLQQAVNF